jgi:hypothetical protein
MVTETAIWSQSTSADAGIAATAAHYFCFRSAFAENIKLDVGLLP